MLLVGASKLFRVITVIYFYYNTVVYTLYSVVNIYCLYYVTV